jgi:hypothetical protein
MPTQVDGAAQGAAAPALVNKALDEGEHALLVLVLGHVAMLGNGLLWLIATRIDQFR